MPFYILDRILRETAGHLGFAREFLPEVLVRGTAFAEIDPNVARMLGLPTSARIVVGTTDGVAAFIATRAHTPGDAVTSLDTTLVVKLLAAQPIFAADQGVYLPSVKTAFKHAVTRAKLGPGVSPHTLRHTAATWLMLNGTDPWQAAGYLGMSVETLLCVYGHHHPDYLKDAVAKMTAKPTASASPQKLAEQKKTNVVKIQ